MALTVKTDILARFYITRIFEYLFLKKKYEVFNKRNNFVQFYNSRFIEFYFHAIFTLNVLMCGLQTFIPITYISYRQQIIWLLIRVKN